MPRSALRLAAVPAIILAGCAGPPNDAVEGSATPRLIERASSSPAPSPSRPAPLPFRGTERADPETLVWSQEFDGPAGSLLDSQTWLVNDYASHPSQSLTSWTARPENVSLTGDGALRITARAETWEDPYGTGTDYTSGRIETVDAFRYGSVEGRVKATAGLGTLSAFWMLGRYEEDGETWPGAGEIDIVELVDEADLVHGTVHGATRIDGHWQQGGTLDSEDGWTDEWHVYRVAWEPESIEFSVDGEVYYRITPDDLAEDQRWSFDEPQHILVNLAVGGSWASAPTDPSVFPAELLVDYIRVYGSEHHPRL
ncbi:glycoside hydrolase family 16 protein [Demequina aestuarii]|uniref:glycoside hydrolase family 16 protein n=1 Tax=Demequina aestuarii TaxID=327095 RepID=UPI0007834FF7|nr:glycoside hydrolase family 16 protein [Demequina aestuarii]